MCFMNTRRRSTPPEILSYDLHVAIWADGVPLRVEGKLEVRNPDSAPLQRIALYLHSELKLTSVTAENDRPIEIETRLIPHDWSYTKSLGEHSLVLAAPIASGESQVFHLSYEGSFSPCCLRGPSDFMRIDDGGAYLRGIGYSLWFPVSVCDGIDAASRFRIRLDVPSPWMGVAFGNLERMEKSAERSLSWWETQSPFKHIQAQLFASSFEAIKGENLTVFAKQGNARIARKLMTFGDQLLDSFASTFGSMDEASRNFVVETCPYGCIASGNVIGLDPDVFQRVGASPIDFETYDLIAHEFVHGYVTPWIDRASPGAALLLEGFPSYFHVPSVTDVLGDAYHEWFFRRAWLSYRDGLKHQTEGIGGSAIPTDKPLLDIKIEEIPYYKDRFLLSDKFPILLDQLRTRIGSDTFLEASKGFLVEGRRRPVAIADFFRFLEIYSGQDLSHFVARWFDSIRPLPDSWEESPQED